VNDYERLHCEPKVACRATKAADLERRYRQAERVALRELLLASSDDDAENDDDWEVNGDGENEASATDQ
jgi:hypothetical protein